MLGTNKSNPEFMKEKAASNIILTIKFRNHNKKA